MRLSLFIDTMRSLVSSQLRRNFVSAIAFSGVSAAMTMIAYPVFLSFLGFEQYGTWLALSSILTMAQLGTLGISPAITKFVAEELARNAKPAAESYAVSGLVVITLSALIVGGIIGLTREQILDFMHLTASIRKIAFDLTLPIAFVSAYTLVTQVSFGVLVAVGRTDQLSFVQAGGKGLSFLLSWALLDRGYGVGSLLWGLLVSQVFMHVASEVLIWRNAKLLTFRLRLLSAERLSRTVRFGFGVFGSSFVQLIGQPLNRMLLSRYSAVALLPHFEVAYAASMQLRALIGASAQSLLPEYSQAAAMSDTARIRRLNSRSLRFVAFAGAPIYLPLFVFAPQVLRIWLQGKFDPLQVPCFRIMLVGSLAILIGASAYQYLLGVARISSVFASQAIQTFGTLAMIAGVVAAVGHLSPVALCTCVTIGFALTSLWLTWDASRHLATLRR